MAFVAQIMMPVGDIVSQALKRLTFTENTLTESIGDAYVESWQGHFDTPVGECVQDMCYFRGDADVGNCIVFVCYLQNDCEAISHDKAWAEYIALKSICEPQDAGGRINLQEHYTVAAYNDPDWTGPGLRALANWTTDNNDGTISGMISLEDLEALYIQEQEAKAKRQEGDFTLLMKSTAVTKDGEKYQVSSILSPGVEQSWDFEETITIGMEMSFGLDAGFWESFTASMGLSFSMEYSTSVKQGIKYSTGSCPDEGLVYYYPLFDHYYGYFGDNAADREDIWIPRELDGFTDGRFSTECLG